MKYLFFILVLMFTTISCNRNTFPVFDYSYSSNPWADAFKDRVFFSAIKEAYKSDTTLFQLIERKDALNPYDGLSMDEMKKADEIGKSLIDKIPPPSMCETCKPGMNYFMATSLHFYISRQLDSVVRKIYQTHKSRELKIH